MKKFLLLLRSTLEALAMVRKTQKMRREVYGRTGVYPAAIVSINGEPALYARQGERGFTRLSNLTEAERLRLQSMRPAASYTLED